MKKVQFNDSDFENLFNTLVNISMGRGDYGNKELFNDICEIYNIKDYSLEIQLIQKRHKLQIMEFSYIEGYVVDVRSTLRSMYNFFKMFITFKEFEEEYSNFLDIAAIKNAILLSLERVINYIERK